jgi:hypothetical protein
MFAAGMQLIYLVPVRFVGQSFDGRFWRASHFQFSSQPTTQKPYSEAVCILMLSFQGPTRHTHTAEINPNWIMHYVYTFIQPADGAYCITCRQYYIHKSIVIYSVL